MNPKRDQIKKIIKKKFFLEFAQNHPIKITLNSGTNLYSFCIGVPCMTCKCNSNCTKLFEHNIGATLTLELLTELKQEYPEIFI